MKIWIEFYEGEPEEHENVYWAGRDETTGFLRVEISDSEGAQKRELYYPMDNIRKMTVIHKKK